MKRRRRGETGRLDGLAGFFRLRAPAVFDMLEHLLNDCQAQHTPIWRSPARCAL